MPSAEGIKTGHPVGGAEFRPPVTTPPLTRVASRAHFQKSVFHIGACSPNRRGIPCIQGAIAHLSPFPLSALRSGGKNSNLFLVRLLANFLDYLLKKVIIPLVHHYSFEHSTIVFFAVYGALKHGGSKHARDNFTWRKI